MLSFQYGRAAVISVVGAVGVERGATPVLTVGTVIVSAVTAVA